MNDYKWYRKKGSTPMRLYMPGEYLTGVFVPYEVTPEEGGMIAYDPNDPANQWYITKAYFNKNYEATGLEMLGEAAK